MPLPQTRAMIQAALLGDLEHVVYMRDACFNLEIPTRCPGVPDAVLNPRLSWQSQESYDQQARKLTAQFVDTMEQFRDQIPTDIIQAGPAAGMPA